MSNTNDFASESLSVYELIGRYRAAPHTASGKSADYTFVEREYGQSQGQSERSVPLRERPEVQAVLFPKAESDV